MNLLAAEFVSGHDFTGCGKVDFDYVLKGHSFSCAVQALYFCHAERASAREGSAFLTFSAASSVVP